MVFHMGISSDKLFSQTHLVMLYITFYLFKKNEHLQHFKNMKEELFNVEIKNTHGKATKVVNDRQGKTIFGGGNIKFIDPQEDILSMGCGHESHTEINDCFFKYLGSPAD